ncbi:mevalonate kinase [Erysipelothrix sp. HDW6C]|uniref:mevalonate kinase n=1 Tax=Erysipelothrix sp. HDW6C TaxID=2714930 RepID=UPI001407F5A7|nr:mevalonate kinase [Erysipelothrix sp. HDW6C]QIK68858.1 mevalonate kinase [Erysipelothrix sp. HDW6C]
MRRSGIGYATGKIILMGEHAVVYGKPAIALPFHAAKIETTVVFHRGATQIECSYYKGDLANAPEVISGVKSLIITTLKYLKKPNKNVRVVIQSQLPAQRGLGSSAAVSVSIVRALFDAFHMPLSDDVLGKLVSVAEEIHHLNPSGLDATTISKGKPVYFDREKGKDDISLNLDGYIVVADTGELGQTRLAVTEVSQRLEENPEVMEPLLNRIHELTEQTRETLESGEIITVGLAMNEVHQILQQFNISNDALDRLVSTARTHGALGAKLTGSGKGGCMIALTRDYETASVVAAALEAEGAIQTWLYSLKEMIHHD